MLEKEKLYRQIQETVEQKIAVAERSIASAKESRDNDTKSSAGDKYETGREMMQAEINKSEAQLNVALQLKEDLQRINLDRTYSFVEQGSLVVTNLGKYFISIGIGRVLLDEEEFYCISLASPIGKLLFKKSVGDKVKFNEREFLIKEIV